MPSLACVWRPDTLKEVCGQKSVIKIIEEQIRQRKFPGCYLFTGPSGCGKTTIGRIVAFEVNAYTNDAGQRVSAKPVEIDAASNNGVDNIRAIIDDAYTRSIDGEYKVFILDECFTKDAVVKTINGDVNIDKVRVGDLVLTPDGYHKVLNCHHHNVNNDRLVTVKMNNGKTINVTKEHYFLTTNGWITAGDLNSGDILINGEDLSDLWRDTKHNNKDTFKRMWREIEFDAQKSITSENYVYTYLCNLRHNVGRLSQACTGDLLEKMLLGIAVNETEGILCYRTWDGEKEVIIRKSKNNSRIRSAHSEAESDYVRKNETEQSIKGQEEYCKSIKNERIEWNSASVDGTSWGKWRVYKGTTSFVRELGKFLGIGISSEDTCGCEKQYESLSYELQTRPCLSFDKIGDRGGWQNASVEKATAKRFEERDLSKQLRVESVEIYQQRNPRECSGMCEYSTEVYDLSIEDCPIYSVNGAFVHNCHMLSVQSWNALLKIIEEPPAKTIFIMCTTDPQKIPSTILNRVMRFNLTKIETKEIVDRLKYICDKEHFTNYDESCEYIAKISNGGMRDAICMLEKCSNYSTDLSICNVLECLGNFSYSVMFDITNAVIDGDSKKVLSMLDDIDNSGNDLKAFVSQYMEFILDLEKYCLFNSMSVVKIPSSVEENVKYVTGIEHNTDYFCKFMNKINDLNVKIKNDVMFKTTISIYFLNMCKGM